MGGIKHLQPLSCKKLQHLHFSNLLPYLDMIFLSRELCLGSTGGGGESGSSVEISVWPAIFFWNQTFAFFVDIQGCRNNKVCGERLLAWSFPLLALLVHRHDNMCRRRLDPGGFCGFILRWHSETQEVQQQIRSGWFLQCVPNKKLASSNILANNGGQHEGGSWFKIFITFWGPFWTLAGSS